jgi:hypothetical protein
MFSITQRNQDWAVLENDEIVSVHPTRAEAERVVVWLMCHTDSSPAQHLQRASASELTTDGLAR